MKTPPSYLQAKPFFKNLFMFDLGYLCVLVVVAEVEVGHGFSYLLNVCVYACAHSECFLNVYLYAPSELIGQCSSRVSKNAVHKVSIGGALPAYLI